MGKLLGLISPYYLVGGIVVVLVIAVLWYRGEAIGSKSKAREFEQAYRVLADKVREQNDAVNEFERRAKEASERGAALKREAIRSSATAKRHADSLAQAMSAPRPVGECIVARALEVVRADLAAVAE